MYKFLITPTFIFYFFSGFCQAGTLDANFGIGGINYTNITNLNRALYTKLFGVALQEDGKIVTVGATANPTAVSRFKQDGSPDSTFDRDGKAFCYAIVARSIAIQNDGKILIGGFKKLRDYNTEFALVRYNSNGSLDPTFGSNGRQTTNITSYQDGIVSLAIERDGKIIAAGYSMIGSYARFAIARYNTNGTIDSSFGSGGIVITTIVSYVNTLTSVAIQDDGKIVAAGFCNDGSKNEFALARYDSRGTLDSSFNSDGKLTASIRSYDDRINSMVIQADGKILVAGQSSNASFFDFAMARYTADGYPDSSFSGDGKLITTLGYSESVCNSIAIQPDGKIVAAGSARNSSNADFALARYKTDGSLDNSLDGDGTVTTAIGVDNDVAIAMVIQSDGKMILAGSSSRQQTINEDFSLVRYNTDGSTDNRFDNDGKLIVFLQSANDVVTSMGVQRDGKLVVAGYSIESSIKTVSAVSRFNANGDLDGSFASNGKLVTSLGSTDDRINAVAIQNDGKIIVAGYSYNGANADFALIRYNTNGSLDSSFDGDGKITTVIGSSTDVINAIAIQSDGKIVVAGYSLVSYTQFALARYNTDGSLDMSFDSDGKLVTLLGSFGGQVNSMAIQRDGKIVVAGFVYNGGNSSDFELVRYNIDGSLDMSFDGDGKLSTHIGLTTNAITSVAIQSDGKIVAAGYTMGVYNGVSSVNLDFALVRYNVNGSPDMSFDGDGKLTTDIDSKDDVPRSIAIQSDGKIIVGGYSNNGNNYDFALVRYNTNGSLDNSFDNDGKILLDLFQGSNESAVSMKLRSKRIYLAGAIGTEGGDDFGIVSVLNDAYSLRLNFLSISGRLNNDDGVLNWKTENEENTLEFIIERSTDDRNYNAVGKINAVNITGSHQYDFTDPDVVSLNASLIYYRLAVKDVDGNFTYSNVIRLPIEKNRNLFLFYPNPVTSGASLIVNIDNPEQVRESIIDNSGRIVKQRQLNLLSGATFLSIDLSMLAKGTYYLQLKGNAVNEKMKFVKL